MTVYAHDPAASAILAVWATGDGNVVHRVGRVPPSLDPMLARLASDALTTLSARLWLAYSEDEVGDVPFGGVREAVLRPNRLVGELLQVADDDRVEAAHHVGRIVSRARGRAFRDAVARDVMAETDAVRRADRGDLSGRAQQAVAHPRPVAAPTQIAVAHALLRADPLGTPEIHTAVEPTAAGVAALRWLRAASTMVAELIGHDPVDVVALAEAIDHEDLRVARFALRMLSGHDESAVVWDLLHESVLAARGRLVVCPDRYEAADEQDEAGHRIITTVLDPREPCRSLLGGVVQGLRGCFRVYIDHVSTRERPGTDPMVADREWATELRTRFEDAVRERMGSPR